MSFSLGNKKILYVAPRFFGYENEIRDELTRRGADVTFLLDRPFESALLKAVTRVRRSWVMGAADRYYAEEMKSLADRDFDYVFVVNGQTLSTETLAQWRSFYPRAKFILYMWDSFRNRRLIFNNIPYFDHVFSFDRDDAEKYSLNFRPLFFSAGFESVVPHEKRYDISFIGTAHSDRFSIVRQIDNGLDVTAKRFWYLYLQAPWVFWLYRVINSGFRSARRSDFKFESISKADVQSVFNASDAILDIEHPQQTGLTMRTLETLGARKKLVTTNKNVKSYDFYFEGNICVVDRKQPRIPQDFFSIPYVDVPPQVYNRYRLAGWVDEIFGSADADE
ncbi:DUF3880 domain-containing protein [Pseudomonas fluorescens]|uniref:DUF3880 domain-containing protein n=1 Tax=Pseudomonas fluorescens TaxID=294 RepID=UPI001BE85772|nr:DUF3880 domain-containing protein [Pseudomonas fluorescens]MBT2374814.1 hypothetical protein [Pseudomonas fluorescens]